MRASKKWGIALSVLFAIISLFYLTYSVIISPVTLDVNSVLLYMAGYFP